jgi:hypothetical protein
VLADRLVLGYADVQVGAAPAGLNSNELIPLVDGRTLPIKFRVEEGALSHAGPEGGIVRLAGGNVTLDVPEGALLGYGEFTAVPKVFDAELERAGLLPECMISDPQAYSSSPSADHPLRRRHRFCSWRPISR